MKVILFGATGMVGQGVLRECLLDPDVTGVLTIRRTATGRQREKLREIEREDLTDYSTIESELTGYDACFFCLGISSVGLTEEQYRRITFDITMAAARTLARLNPDMTFIYVSGKGADSTERGRSMWARVRGETENALLRLPFKGVYIFRPAVIQPLHGAKSKTRLYRALYIVMAPLLSLLNAMLPKYVTTTERIGRAMLRVVRQGAPKRVLETGDINRVAKL